MTNLFSYLLPITLLTQIHSINQTVLPIPLVAQAQVNPDRFLQNIEFLKVTKVEGEANVTEGQIIRNVNDMVSVESGYITLTSNDGRLRLKVEASTIFYISSNDRTEKTITLFVQQGFIRATLNQSDVNPNRIIINTPGGYAAIRGTDISVTVSDSRVRFSMIHNTAEIDGEETLLQGNSLLRYADGTNIITQLKEDYLISLEQFSLDPLNKRFNIVAKTNNQNSVLYKGEFLRVSPEGIFNLNISSEDNYPIILLTPFGTTVHFQVSSRGLI